MITPQDINNTFRTFYSNLYTTDIDPSSADINSFLNKINLPQLSKEHAQALDKPLTQTEFHKALTQMPNNKAPGPDGFPAEFFKHFWLTISTLFIRMALEIKHNSKIPPHMNTALISVLLKPGKDPTLPSSYCPLSLINTNIKIISKALATRIETVTPNIIHHD